MADDKTALRDEIKQKDRRIEELREEVDDLRGLVSRMEENVDDAANVLENWKEAFGMIQGPNGGWNWGPFWNEYQATIAAHNELVHRWNRYLPLIRQQPVGRPLAASEAQCAHVMKLRRGGRSLRDIADESSLGLSTVRTIVGKANGTDRVTRRRWERIKADPHQAARRKRQKRQGDALPRQAQHVAETARALVKEAKGLGRPK